MKVKLRPSLFLLGLLLSGLNSLYAAAGNCVAEKARFRELYIALQQSLNYEGKDAVLENGNLVLKPHKADSAYEGKVFEAALHKEYSLALKKVGAIYQAAKFENFEKSNPALVAFIKAVDGNDENVAQYLKQNKVDKVIDELAVLSKSESNKKKYGNSAIITDNDKYLLKKLLTHAQDRICSVSKFEEREQKTGKQTRDNNFTAEELNLYRNAPLNRLINSIKNGKIAGNSDLKIEELKNSEIAINQAIAKNLQALKDWRAKNEKCLKDILNPSFIQAGIQSCNYNLFVNTLDKGNENNLEALLHFINSNEKFRNNPAAKAETALDEMKLEAAIDQAFNGVGKREACPVLRKKDSTIFVNNLPFNEGGGFKKSALKFTCSKGKNVIDSAQCENNIEFVSNGTGEGIEIHFKQSKTMQLKVENNENCGGSSNAIVIGENDGSGEKTPEMCAAEGKVPSSDKNSCVDPKTKEDCDNVNKANEKIKDNKILRKFEWKNNQCSAIKINDSKSCAAEGKILSTDKTCVDPKSKDECDKLGIINGKNYDWKNNACVEAKANDSKTCAAEGKILAADKTCIDPKSKDDCDKLGKENGKNYEWKNNACVEAVQTPAKKENCDEENKNTAGKKYKLNDEKTACVEEVAAPVKKDNCDEENKNAEGKKFKLNDEKTACVEEKEDKKDDKKDDKKKKKMDEEGCIEKNNKSNEDDLKNGDSPSNRFSWNSKTKSCDDKQNKKDSDSDFDDEDDSSGKTRRTYPQTPTPQRFTPIQVPTWQMYVLPGMP